MEDSNKDISPVGYFFKPLTQSTSIILIIIIGMIVFSNALFNSFVWDDIYQIQNNPSIQSISNIPRFFSSSTFGNLGGIYYRPVLSSVFSIIYTLSLGHVFFFHFFQIAIHIFNTILIFILLKKFFDGYISFFLSLLFLIHPINVEAVSYMSALNDPLFFLFGISALILSLKERISTRRAITIFLLLLCSILSKETGILFSLLILIYSVFFKNMESRAHRLQVFFYTSSPIIVYLFLRFFVAKIYFEKDLLAPIALLPFSERALSIPAIILFYLKTFFVPVQLIVDQKWIIANINFQDFYLPLLVDLFFFFSLIIFAAYLFKRNKKFFYVFLFFFLWFFSGLLMHLQIFPLTLTVSDRWFYFPIIGLLGFIAIILELLKQTHKNLITIFYLLYIVFIILFSTRTIIRNNNWANAITLFSHDARLKNNFDIENALGSEYATRGDLDQAIVHFKKSISMWDNDKNLFNLASVYDKIGKKELAKEYYSRAIKKNVSPTIQGRYAYENFAILLYFNDELELARKTIKNGLKIYPASGSLWVDLAITEYKLGNYDQALDAVDRAKIFLPSSLTNYVYDQILNKRQINLSQ